MSEQKSVPLRKDPLFLALTRPAMLLGIPYFAAIAEGLFASVFMIGTGNLLYTVGLVVPLHLGLMAFSAKDPGKFGGVALWLKTNALCQNARYWGAPSFSPINYTQTKPKPNR